MLPVGMLISVQITVARCSKANFIITDGRAVVYCSTLPSEKERSSLHVYCSIEELRDGDQPTTGHLYDKVRRAKILKECGGKKRSALLRLQKNNQEIQALWLLLSSFFLPFKPIMPRMTICLSFHSHDVKKVIHFSATLPVTH